MEEEEEEENLCRVQMRQEETFFKCIFGHTGQIKKPDKGKNEN